MGQEVGRNDTGGTKGYRVYNTSTHEIKISREDVIIMEQITIHPEIPPEVGEELSESSEGSGNDLEGTHEKEVIEKMDDDTSDSDFTCEIKEQEAQNARLNVRRSEHKPEHFDDYVTILSASTTNTSKKVSLEEDPVTVDDALSRPDSEKWKKAMAEELMSFDENKAWDVVKMPEWVFKRENESDGSVRYRARLVARRGFTQLPGVDFDETFSPLKMDEENQIDDKLQRKRELTNERVKKYRKRKRMESQQLNPSMQDDPNEEMESMRVQEKIAERKKAMAKERSRRYREKKRLNALQSVHE